MISLCDKIYTKINEFSASVYSSTMKSIIIILIFASIQVSTLQNFQNDSASIPLFTIPMNENSSCLTQQQREDSFREFRNVIASNLNNVTVPSCKGEGWTRVAYLNMGDPMQSCPPAWRDGSANGVRVCGRPAGSNFQCHSTIYSTSGHLYSIVCGRVIGYQFGHTDAFRFVGGIINQPYVDGVSITHGNPRLHIWTLAAGISENDKSGRGCPCEGGRSAPSFVGDNYYCESGYNGTFPSGLLTSDPLWDGAGCESEGSCCSTAPWFTVDLVNPTSDDIEVRICANSDHTEDTPIHLLELYIQ